MLVISSHVSIIGRALVILNATNKTKVLLYFRCKLLVVGGGSGGCTVAAKFARRLNKDSVIILEPSNVSFYVCPLKFK